jgi:hypothetical protein
MLHWTKKTHAPKQHRAPVANMRVIVLTILLLASAVLALGQGQVAPERPAKRIVTRTRLVSIFSDLESQLFKGLQGNEEQSMDALLAEDFQLWTPTPPGDPVPRDDWRKQALAERLKAFSIRQMGASSVDENAVLVHFVLSKTVELGGKTSVQDYFVMDMWQKSDDKWQLRERYASPLAGCLSKPGKVRPSGKN